MLSDIMWLARSAALLLICSCASSPHGSASHGTPAASGSVVPAATQTVASPSPVCRKQVPGEADLLAEIVDGLRQPETGAYQMEQTQLVRYMPLLHESGTVTSIVATHSQSDGNPVFALTMLARNASGGMDAYLGFASAPCPDGDLTLAVPLIPLGVAEARIQYESRIPYSAIALTELRLDLGEAVPPGNGSPRSPPKARSFAVGMNGIKMTVLGTIDLDVDLPPENGIRRRDSHLFGTAWYRYAGGASYLLTHHVTYDVDDLCKAKNAKKKKWPAASPPQLRLAAHLDPVHGFSTDPSVVGVAYVVAIGENQPPAGVLGKPDLTLQTGPTALADPYFERGPPAQWLVGLFESAEAANAGMRTLSYTTGTIYATAPAQPSTIKVTPMANGDYFDCDPF